MIAATALVEDGADLGAGTSVWHHAIVRTGATVGTECVIGSGAFIDADVIVGDRCKIQNHAQLFAPARLGDGVFIGPSVVLTNDRHPRAVNSDQTLKSAADWDATGVVVHRGASLGAGAVVVAGVTIGEWALVAAGAVVTTDVPAHGLVAGVPAQRLGWVGKDGERLEPTNTGWVGGDGTRYVATADGLREESA